MAISLAAALLISGIASAIAGTGATIASSKINADSVNRTNAANAAAQLQANQENIAYSREYAQNGIQWKMQDLQAAGLNPVLAAGGAFGGTPSSPTVQAPHQQAPQVDFSGIASALNAANNSVLTAYIMDQKKSISGERNDALQSISGGRNDTLKSIAHERNEVLKGLYRRKASALNDVNKYSGFVKDAKQIANNSFDDKEWNDLMKEFKKLPGYKYKWK